MSATCRSCPTEVVWGRFDTSGKPSLFDVEAAEPGPGTFALIRGVAYAWSWISARAKEKTAEDRGVSTARALALLSDVGAWHASHFATCPAAAHHRQARAS